MTLLIVALELSPWPLESNFITTGLEIKMYLFLRLWLPRKYAVAPLDSQEPRLRTPGLGKGALLNTGIYDW